MLFNASLTILFLFSSFLSSRAISTVEEVNYDKYLGLWIQVYASPFVFATFERNGVCVAATYGINDDGSISVFNQLREFTYDGELKTIEGSAVVPNPEKPGQLSVKFDSNALFGAPYWIVKLGPETYGDEGLYEYSIVTDPLKIGLYVLVRDLNTFKSQYEDEVLSFLEGNGFTHFWNKPVETIQDDCEYVSSDDTLVSMKSSTRKASTIDTVDTLDINKYIGRWYQVYAGKFSYITTESAGSCIAADYGLISSNNISVFNQGLKYNGAFTYIAGFAYIPDANEPGKLIVQFSFSAGDYWVVKLGPDSYSDDGLYEYSVITDRNRINLFVLARDVDAFKLQYEEEVLDFLSSNGFNEFWNSPIDTNQENCTYVNEPPQ